MLKLLINETAFGNRNGVLQAMASATAYAKEDATSKEGTKGIRVGLFLREEGTSENRDGELWVKNGAFGNPNVKNHYKTTNFANKFADSDYKAYLRAAKSGFIEAPDEYLLAL